MLKLPPDHPQRRVLADEAHARPFETVPTPARVTYVAVLIDGESRAAEHAQVARLCGLHGATPPAPGDTHFIASLGAVRLKWERHGEFSGYMVIAPGVGDEPFAEPAGLALPPGWWEALPGHTVVAVHAELRKAPPEGLPQVRELARHFGGHMMAGSAVAEGAAHAFTDFRLHDDGCARILVFDRNLNPRQAGRLLQRLFEIEAYRMLALLALPMAREQLPRIVAIERSLSQTTDGIARDSGRDEDLLHGLTRLAAEVENGIASSHFRFGACRAYSELVDTRIAELREQRLPGLQTLQEFMARRFKPAVATCLTVSQRLRELSDRIAQANTLLATRVGIVRERQNQQLLASMDRRARLQLRLQRTVEGLSVAAIVYYVVGVVGLVAKGMKSGGVPLNPDLVAGLAVPVCVGAVMLALRRARKSLADSSHDD